MSSTSVNLRFTSYLLPIDPDPLKRSVMKKIEPKTDPKKVLKTKRKYTAPLIEVVLIDHEIALVMASESPTPPPEFLKIPLLNF